MCLLRWTDEHTLEDRFQNEDIKKVLGVANIEDEMRKIVYIDFVMCKED